MYTDDDGYIERIALYLTDPQSTFQELFHSCRSAPNPSGCNRGFILAINTNKESKNAQGMRNIEHLVMRSES